MAAEVALVRRGGEDAALARINHLKGTVAAHERNVALLTSTLAAQHELLAEVAAGVDALARALPGEHRGLHEPPPVDWTAVASAVRTLQQRVRRGAAASSGRGASAVGARRTPPATSIS